MDNRPIGVFDSGVGGLTVVKQIMKKLPEENIVYFGDTARLPYGSKSKETVTRFSRQIIQFLLKKDVKAIIIACNTASSNSLDTLKAEFDVPLFGVVTAGVEEALKTTVNKKIGVIGTKGTIRSNAYKNLICSADKNVQVFSMPCPLFVPLVEEGWTDNEITKLTAQQYLRPIVDKGIDSLVLGCTHYPLLKRCIGETIGDAVKLVDPAKGTALQVKKFLLEHKMINEGTEKKESVFYVSDLTELFESLCQKAFKKVYHAQKVDIENYE